MSTHCYIATYYNIDLDGKELAIVWKEASYMTTYVI